jgi:phosphate-selective porin O/P
LTRYIGCALLRGVTGSRRRSRGALQRAAVVLLLGLASTSAHAQVVVKVNDDVNFRLGLLLQGWADWTQDAVSEGYSQNFFLRRIRFLVTGNVARNITFFYQTDNARLGNAGTTGTKSLNTGFLTQDAFGEWKIAGDKLMLNAGLFYTPQSRGILDSSSSVLSFDAPSFGQQQVAATGSSSGRDVGFALKGYLAGDRLEYRAGVFSGQRQAATTQGAGSRNAPRFAARLQYDFFDIEKGYTYPGTNRGTKKILALGAWGDSQGDFRAYGADAMLDLPVVGKDALTVEVDYLHYDGGREFPQVSGGVVTPALPAQGAWFSHAGYYFDAVKLQPFVRYERLDFSDDAFRSRDQQRYGGGLNWYIAGQNLKLSAFYERIVPKVRPAAAAIKNTNHFAVQLQAYYF